MRKSAFQYEPRSALLACGVKSGAKNSGEVGASGGRALCLNHGVGAWLGAVPVVVFVHADGRREAHAAAVGASVMDCAVDNGVQGIRAQCGGGCTCSTCHAVVDEQWFAKVGAPVGDERDILEFTPGREPRSRLTCQIALRDDIDGLVVYIPAPED